MRRRMVAVTLAAALAASATSAWGKTLKERLALYDGIDASEIVLGAGERAHRTGRTAGPALPDRRARSRRGVVVRTLYRQDEAQGRDFGWCAR